MGLSDEAKVKVRLDTKQAKGELRGLSKSGSQAAGRIGGGIRRGIGRGLAFTGLGVGVGAAVSAIRSPSQGAMGAMISQTFGALGAKISHNLFGEAGYEAQGGARALQAVSDAYAPGGGGPHAPGAREMFKFYKSQYTREATARGAFAQDEEFRNETAQKIADAVEKFFLAATSFQTGVSKWWDDINKQAERRAKEIRDNPR